MLRNGTGIGNFSCFAFNEKRQVIIEWNNLSFLGDFHYYTTTELHFQDKFEIYKDFKNNHHFFYSITYRGNQYRR
jgi:hypothetical protein